MCVFLWWHQPISDLMMSFPADPEWWTADLIGWKSSVSTYEEMQHTVHDLHNQVILIISILIVRINSYYIHFHFLSIFLNQAFIRWDVDDFYLLQYYILVCEALKSQVYSLKMNHITWKATVIKDVKITER